MYVVNNLVAGTGRPDVPRQNELNTEGKEGNGNDGPRSGTRSIQIEKPHHSQPRGENEE